MLHRWVSIRNRGDAYPILCSKSQKTGVPKGKSAQKCRFCARNARKRGFRRAKAHKNLDFVLERAENEGFEWQKRTKMPILCSGMVAASSALPATSPAGCIWQQCARQQIAATYPVHTPGQPTCRSYYRAMGPTVRWVPRPAGG